MGASQRVIPQAELDAGFNLFKDIIAIVKDPKGLEEAHKAAREQAALTEEEQNKVIEARAFYSDADEKAAEYRKREDAIFAGEDELKRAGAEFIQYKASEGLRLKNLEDELKNQTSDLAKGQQQLEKDTKALETKEVELLAEHNRKISELSAKISEVETLKKTLEAEGQQVAKTREEQANRDEQLTRILVGKV